MLFQLIACATFLSPPSFPTVVQLRSGSLSLSSIDVNGDKFFLHSIGSVTLRANERAKSVRTSGPYIALSTIEGKEKSIYWLYIFRKGALRLEFVKKFSWRESFVFAWASESQLKVGGVKADRVLSGSHEIQFVDSVSPQTINNKLHYERAQAAASRLNEIGVRHQYASSSLGRWVPGEFLPISGGPSGSVSEDGRAIVVNTQDNEENVVALYLERSNWVPVILAPGQASNFQISGSFVFSLLGMEPKRTCTIFEIPNGKAVASWPADLIG